VCDLSNGAISNDLNRTLTLFQGHTIFLDAEYLTNGYRYGHSHSYYGRGIWNRTQTFKWHQFQWSWV